MQIGIFAKTFSGKTPLDVLQAVRKSGFECAQYNMACSGLPAMPDAIDAATAAAVRCASTATQIPLVAVSATYNMIHPDPAERAAGHRRLQVIAAKAKAMGIPLLTLCTGTRDATDQWRGHPDNASPQAWNDLLRAMEQTLEVAEAHDIDLGIEPELANVVNSPTAARRLILQLQSERIKIVLDPANLFERTERTEQQRLVSQAIDGLADRIVMAHAKDRRADGSFTIAGKGVLDYEHYLNALLASGFTGPLVAHGIEAKDAAATARFLRNKLEGAR
tara:strand:+ start:1206 stop:2036 length:831 start_codon:yes stop_codon:yes gene_type:complete